MKEIEAKPGYSIFYTVACDKRKNLPDLVINMGGFDLTLTAYGYTTVMERHECAIWFASHQDNKDEKPYLRLEIMFLKSFIPRLI